MSGRLGIYSQVGNSSSIDPDAQAFISAALITGTTQQDAIKGLVPDLKGTSGSTTNGTDVWSKLAAVYPMCPIDGSTFTLDACKWNLINPLDTDAAFRMTWVNAPTVSYGGVKGDGSAAYGDTHYAASNILASNSFLTSVSELGTFNGRTVMGVYMTASFAVFSPYQLNFSQFRFYSPNLSSIITVNSSLGIWQSVVDSNVLTVYKNGTSVSNIGATYSPSPVWANPNIIVFGEGRSTGATRFSNPKLDFVVIGQGLTANEVQDLSDAITNFNTALGR